MNPERLKKLESLYNDARLLPPDQRTAWLAAVCASDRALQSEVESLLLQLDRSDGLLGVPAIEAGARMMSGSVRVLTTGMKLGIYEIVEVAGTGGMGEVYRARDSRLKRDVAIKVLPQNFAADRDRVVRFEREAQVLASLNHPNVGAIFGIDDSTGTPALILEYIAGDTLADRLKNGPIPLGETLAIAKQITDALQAAHEKGTVHRDLKPSNIKVSREGNVKILDFGLAKVFSNDGFENSADSRRSFDPTNTGVILGTAAYMSPEQAKGEEVDKQTDIWAFGCVLYEMLTGTPPFRGKTTTDVIASVLRSEPDWSLLNADARHLQPILARCLEKPRSHRIHDVADAQILLEALAASVTVTKARSVSRRKPLLIAAAAGFVGIIALVILLLSKPFPEAHSMRFIIPEPEQAVFLTGAGVEPQPTVSPDGRRLVFRATDRSGSTPTLWLRSFDNVEAQKLPGTDNGTQPFWSPDSRSIAFFADGKLKRIDISGGPAETLADINPFEGGTWSPDGKILLGQGSGGGGLREVSSTEGQVRPATKVDGSNERFHRLPQFLPDGRHFIYVADPPWTAYVTSLDATDRKLLFRAESKVVYAQPGYLLFVRGGSLFAQKFDASRLELTGQPFVIAENVRTNGAGRAAFSVSDNGMLVYRTGNSDALKQLTWFDRNGRTLGTVAAPGNYQGIDLSPDDQQVAVHRHEISGGDVWLASLIRDSFTRFTFDSARDYTTPVWSPDGRIAFVNDNGKQSIYWKASSGAGEDQVLRQQADDSPAPSLGPRSFAPKGESLVYEDSRATSGIDLWILPLTGNRQPFALLQNAYDEFKAQISPNGQWIAYTSNESGPDEVYVRPFPSVSTGKWQISTQGGDQPRWRRDGQEMFFMASDRTLMAVEVKTHGEFEHGNPHALFRTRVSTARLRFDYAVSRDGQRFLINTVREDQSTRSTPITVVVNWTAGVAKK